MCCSLRAGSAVVKPSLFVILSAGVSLVVQGVETGFPTCYWASDLRSLKAVCTVRRKRTAAPLCMKPAGRQASLLRHTGNWRKGEHTPIPAGMDF